MRITWRALRLQYRRKKQRLLAGGKITRVVHFQRSSGPPVAGRIHRKDVQASVGQERHPAVVLVRHVERYFGWRARAVHENDGTAVKIGSGRNRCGFDALTHVNLSALS